MANPYHDETGKFCSRGEMGTAIEKLRREGDVSGYMKLRSEYESIESGQEITAEDIADKLKPAFPLQDNTPVEIDNELAKIYGEFYKKQDEIAVVDSYIKNYEQALDPEYRFYRGNEHDIKRNEQGLAKQQLAKEKLEAEAEEILAKAKPGEDEFKRRGGWTRAFLVDNTYGHVHKNRSCTTCFPTTRYAWLPDYSGSDESKVVEDAGEAACTMCYPTAPVDVLKRKSLIELPERKAARLEREEAKRVREAKNEEKGILSPDGRPLKIESGYGIIKSHRTAQIEAVDIYVTQKAQASGKYGSYVDSQERKDIKDRDMDTLVKALANKFGRTYDEQQALITSLGEKKYKKEWS